MTTVVKNRTHLMFKPMQVIYNLITNEITDINSKRSALPTPRERQWVYPTYPEAEDENYPRIALIAGTATPTPYGTGDFIEYERDISGNAEHMVFGKVVKLPITIGVFVKKNQPHQVTYFDGTTHTIRNTKQVDFVGDLIPKIIYMFRSKYFIPENMDIKVVSVSETYEDNDFLYAKNISIEIEMFDEWEFDFTDPSSTVGIIQNIDLNIDVTRV